MRSSSCSAVVGRCIPFGDRSANLQRIATKPNHAGQKTSRSKTFRDMPPIRAPQTEGSSIAAQITARPRARSHSLRTHRKTCHSHSAETVAFQNDMCTKPRMPIAAPPAKQKNSARPANWDNRAPIEIRRRRGHEASFFKTPRKSQNVCHSHLAENVASQNDPRNARNTRLANTDAPKCGAIVRAKAPARARRGNDEEYANHAQQMASRVATARETQPSERPSHWGNRTLFIMRLGREHESSRFRASRKHLE